jgi:putative sterol carrier protein
MPAQTVQEMILGHAQAFLPEKAAGVDAIIQYKLTGEEGGDWIITIKDGKCTVAQGLAPNPRLTLLANADDFRGIFLGKIDGITAFLQGKLKVSGDMNLAMRFNSFFKH